MSPERGGRRLRPLVEADLDAAMRIERQRVERPWSREQLRQELDRCALALELDGALIGYACLAIVRPESELLTIVVAAEARGHGHGGWLLDRVLEAAADAGCDDVRLEVRPSNAAALAMYHGRGFHDVGRRAGYYGERGEDALLLRVSIARRSSPSTDPIAGPGRRRV